MSQPTFKIFVINLKRSPERLAKISEQLTQQGLTFERVEAFDGKDLSDEFIEQVSPKHLAEKSYYRALSKGEVGCALSHKKAWQKIIDDELDFAIVLEDDLSLESNFAQTVAFIQSLPKEQWDFFKFFPLTRSSEKNIDLRFTYNQQTLVTYHKFPLGCQGQAISLKAARNMVENMPFILEPVDSQLKSWWQLDIHPFGLLPYCVTTEIGGQSDINPNSVLEQSKQNKWVKMLNKAQKGLARKFNQKKLSHTFNDFCHQLKKSK